MINIYHTSIFAVRLELNLEEKKTILYNDDNRKEFIRIYFSPKNRFDTTINNCILMLLIDVQYFLNDDQIFPVFFLNFEIVDLIFSSPGEFL